jgi:multiple sugar transport system substrate-binding protein
LNSSQIILSALSKGRLNRSFIVISLLILLMLTLSSYTNFFPTVNSFGQASQEISLNAILVEPRDRWDILLSDAIKILKARHSDIDIKTEL